LRFFLGVLQVEISAKAQPLRLLSISEIPRNFGDNGIFEISLLGQNRHNKITLTN
jgi:hypothetical protein